MATAKCITFLHIHTLARICKKCLKTKILFAFPTHPKGMGGYYHICLECMQVLGHQWKEAHPKEYRSTNKRSKEKRAERNRFLDRLHYLNNKEYHIKKNANYYQEHREERIEYAHHYRHANHEAHLKAVKISVLNRKARQKGLPNTLKSADVEFARRYWHGACAVCGTENGLWNYIALDHWIPLANAASLGSTPENIIPLCHAKKNAPKGTTCCNNAKGKKDPFVWLTAKLGPRKAKAKLKEIDTYFALVKERSALCPAS